MYGMKRTTVYLPEDMKARLEQEAARRKITEAELIRQAVDKELRGIELRGALFISSHGPFGADLTGAERDTWLEGFGES